MNDPYACKDTYDFYFNDTHGEKVPSNKTLALAKSINMDIWIVGRSTQLFIRGSYAVLKCSKK